MRNKHKDLIESLTSYYVNHYDISPRIVKDIIVETMAQTSLLAINDFVDHETKNAVYKMAVKGLSVN